MSIYLSMVNQKLLFARLLAGELDQTGENPHRQKALLESMVFQLRLAWLFHLQDIASNYQCPRPQGVTDLSALAQQLEILNKWPSEAREMQSLLDIRGSWLEELLRSYDSCFAVSDPQSQQAPVASSTELIALTRLAETEDIADLTPGLVQGWFESLLEMIERHREGMFEC